MKKKYLVTHVSSAITFLFVFDSNGVIVEYKSNFKSNAKTVPFLKAHFPFESKSLQYFKESKSFKLEEINQDLSFINFWNTYKHKVGNKKRAERLWDLLSDTDKAKALNYIKRYENILLQGNVQKLYPETYLNQRRFDNE